jgi:hypothetical protein
MDKFDLAFWPVLRLLACYVELLFNKCVLYQILSEKSTKKTENLLDLTLYT